MKRKILTLAAVVGCLAVLTPEVRADPRDPSWGISFGVGFGGGHFGGFVGSRHRQFHRPGVIVAPAHGIRVHRQVPVFQAVWVPARHEQVLVGYDRCGMPLYRLVCVSPGHYEQVIVGYRRCD